MDIQRHVYPINQTHWGFTIIVNGKEAVKQRWHPETMKPMNQQTATEQAMLAEQSYRHSNVPAPDPMIQTLEERIADLELMVAELLIDRG